MIGVKREYVFDKTQKVYNKCRSVHHRETGREDPLVPPNGASPSTFEPLTSRPRSGEESVRDALLNIYKHLTGRSYMFFSCQIWCMELRSKRARY